MSASASIPFKISPIRTSTYSSVSKPSGQEISIEEDVHLHPWNSVSAVSVAYTAGSDKFSRMHNAHVSIDNLDGLFRTGLFAVFDGSGSGICANALTRDLPEAYVKHSKTAKSENECWLSAFRDIDDRYRQKMDLIEAGATAACVVIKTVEGKRVASYANVGDVGIMAIQEGHPIKLSELHNEKHFGDSHRVRRSGGTFDGRVKITRCFGENILKRPHEPYTEPILISTPHCRIFELTPAISHIVIGSRDIWNSLSEKVIADMVTKADHDIKSAAKNIINASYYDGDNKTIMIIDLRTKKLSL